MQTTIIISNLRKQDFVAAAGAPLSLANQIKLAVLNLAPLDGADFIHSISHWSELPFINRIIVIFKSAAAAAAAYRFLQTQTDAASDLALPPSVKLSLQDNLLSRSKSHEALADASELKVTESLAKFKSKHTGYDEPAPQHFDACADLQKLGIDVSALNQAPGAAPGAAAAGGPARKCGAAAAQGAALGRSRSTTKTLFRPPLSIDTKGSTPDSDTPSSPSITLEFAQ